MWPLSTRQPRRARTTLARRAAFRPRLEALEDRSVPSTAGYLDTSFAGPAGYVTNSTNGVYIFRAVAVQPDGKIVAAGSATPSGKPQSFALARYNADGSPDGTFGSGGLVVASTVGRTAVRSANSLALQGD